ncbi:MAG: transposase [Candidatus Acidiferrales bacterium]
MEGAVWPITDRSTVDKDCPLRRKPPTQRRGGRPRIENRRVLAGILWILRSGARWRPVAQSRQCGRSVRPGRGRRVV